MLSKSYLFALTTSLLLSASVDNASAADPTLTQDGSQVYYNHCLHCHGKNGEGDGHLVNVLKVKPTNLTTLGKNGCVSKKVLGAVLGKHKTGSGNNKMPLLKESLSIEKVYALSEHIETLQK